MAKSIVIGGVTYQDTKYVTFDRPGGGTATYIDADDADANRHAILQNARVWTRPTITATRGTAARTVTLTEVE